MKLVLVDCGNCRYVFAHRKPTPDELTCPNCGWSSEPCDFPDTNAWQRGNREQEHRACLSSLVIMEEVEAYPKNCTKCDKGIWEGYQIETFKGVDYFCSDACAFNKGYTKEQYLKDYAEGGDTYWTEWEVSA